MFCYLLFLFSNKSWVPLHVKKNYLRIYPSRTYFLRQLHCILPYGYSIFYLICFINHSNLIPVAVEAVSNIQNNNLQYKYKSHPFPHIFVYLCKYIYFFFFAYKQQTFISYSLRGCEVQGQDTSRVSDWWVSTSWFINSYLLTVS